MCNLVYQFVVINAIKVKHENNMRKKSRGKCVNKWWWECVWIDSIFLVLKIYHVGANRSLVQGLWNGMDFMTRMKMT